MMILRHLPNALTCANLLCGCLGIVFILKGETTPAAFFVWTACAFDFFDGFAARLLKVSSAIGKELDSLADMVSFGVLPAMMMYQWINQISNILYLPYCAFIIAVFSALRLAKFNIDERQTTSFIGLPTPANALFLTALPFLPDPLMNWVQQPIFLVAICVAFSLLLVAEIELFALKFKNFGWAGNEIRYLFILVSIFLLIFLTEAALPLIILLYILSSFIKSLVGRSAVS